MTAGQTILWDIRGTLLTAGKQRFLIWECKTAIITSESPFIKITLFPLNYSLFSFEKSPFGSEGYCHPLSPLLKLAPFSLSAWFTSELQGGLETPGIHVPWTGGNAWPGWVAWLTSVPVIWPYCAGDQEPYLIKRPHFGPHPARPEKEQVSSSIACLNSRLRRSESSR